MRRRAPRRGEARHLTHFGHATSVHIGSQCRRSHYSRPRWLVAHPRGGVVDSHGRLEVPGADADEALLLVAGGGVPEDAVVLEVPALAGRHLQLGSLGQVWECFLI